jgi:ribosomal protein S18 acetylase RimI-like enzyme
MVGYLPFVLGTSRHWKSAAEWSVATFTLEPIGEDDFEFRYRVYEITIKPYLYEMMDWSEDQHRAMIRSNFAGSTSHSAIVVDGKRAGVVRIVEHDKVIDLEQIEILPEFQGKGIGTAVVQSLIDRAIRTGKVVDLSVFVANTGARRLYERLGFSLISESERDVQMRYTPPSSWE